MAVSPPELAAAMSHELRTPLTVITGYAELLRTRRDEAFRLEAAARIVEAADRLSAVIDELAHSLDPTGAVATEPLRPSAAAAGTRLASRSATSRPYRILLVDDDAALRSLLRATLPADGFQILEARDGGDALEQIAVRRPDLMVLDWNMPERTGAQVLDELQREDADIPVIILTVEARDSHRALARALGARRFLTKPFSPTELLDAVEELLPRDDA